MLKPGLEDRKDFIAKMAACVFGQKGYKASSLQDVARQAEISKAGLYHYFKSKEDILFYILINNSDLFLEKLRTSLSVSREQELTPEESFIKLIQTYANHINNDEDKRLIVLRERHQLSTKRKKELFKREQAMFRLIKNELLKIGNLEQKINPNVVTFLFISMSHWLGYWFKEGKGLDIQTIINQSIDTIFHGMLKRS